MKEDGKTWAHSLVGFTLAQIVALIIWGSSVEKRISVDAERFDALQSRITNLDTPLGRKVIAIEQRFINNEEQEKEHRQWLYREIDILKARLAGKP